MHSGRALSIVLTTLLLIVVALVLYFLHRKTSFKSSHANLHHYIFNIEVTSITKLCGSQNVVTVNGMLPGPTLYLTDGDSVAIQVVNNCPYNATIHWHGVRQLHTVWADGPEYVTQCPIPPGGRYTYRFTVIDQEGTLWWHAHVSWLKATVHGAIVIYPKHGSSFPFTNPSGETTIVLGEWWNSNPMDVIEQAVQTGSAPDISDAIIINGQPGDLYPCSSSETWSVNVNYGETYMLRIINAAVNTQLFFRIARHDMTVVAVDASYTKPLTTDLVIVAPGQTTDVLVTADQEPATYYMAARAYSSSEVVAFINTTSTAIFQYSNTPKTTLPLLPDMPEYNDTSVVTDFTTALRSLNTERNPVKVPIEVEERIITTVGLGVVPCDSPHGCTGPGGRRMAASMNNVSFVLPSSTSILEAMYKGTINGVFDPDFPDGPPSIFDYTGNVPDDGTWMPVKATKVKVVRYGSNVEMVMQGTSIISAENHPMHLHGYDFYVVAEGTGNFEPVIDTFAYNLVDPPRRNTVGVPANGWVVIRFIADNPGAWFMHCHLDSHLTWGLSTVIVVSNDANQLFASIGGPPLDFPLC